MIKLTNPCSSIKLIESSYKDAGKFQGKKGTFYTKGPLLSGQEEGTVGLMFDGPSMFYFKIQSFEKRDQILKLEDEENNQWIMETLKDA